jgi:protein PsiE
VTNAADAHRGGRKGPEDPTPPQGLSGLLRQAGTWGLLAVERTGLVLVTLATIYATYLKVRSMILTDEVTISDLLLLFIYLEVVSMARVYWQAHKLPVRMPLYIAMVALARYLMFTAGHVDAARIVALAAAVLVLSLAVLVVRFGHLRYPYPETRDGTWGEGYEDRSAP